MPSTPGPSDVIIRKEPAHSPLPPRGAQKSGSTGDPKLTKARGVMHPKPRSPQPERRRETINKVIKGIPTNAEMLSSLEGDTPSTALLRLTERVWIAPHTTQKIQVYYPDPTHAGGSVSYRIEVAQPWGSKVDDSLPVECRVMPGVSKTRQGQQGRGGALSILAINNTDCTMHWEKGRCLARGVPLLVSDKTFSHPPGKGVGGG